MATTIPMNKTTTTQLTKQLNQLFIQHLKLSDPIYMLHILREKLTERSYQKFDKEDIMNELGRIQCIANDLNKDMLIIYDLLQNETL